MIEDREREENVSNEDDGESEKSGSTPGICLKRESVSGAQPSIEASTELELQPPVSPLPEPPSHASSSAIPISTSTMTSSLTPALNSTPITGPSLAPKSPATASTGTTAPPVASKSLSQQTSAPQQHQHVDIKSVVTESGEQQQQHPQFSSTVVVGAGAGPGTPLKSTPFELVQLQLNRVMSSSCSSNLSGLTPTPVPAHPHPTSQLQPSSGAHALQQSKPAAASVPATLQSSDSSVAAKSTPAKSTSRPAATTAAGLASVEYSKQVSLPTAGLHPLSDGGAGAAESHQRRPSTALHMMSMAPVTNAADAETEMQSISRARLSAQVTNPHHSSIITLVSSILSPFGNYLRNRKGAKNVGGLEATASKTTFSARSAPKATNSAGIEGLPQPQQHVTPTIVAWANSRGPQIIEASSTADIALTKSTAAARFTSPPLESGPPPPPSLPPPLPSKEKERDLTVQLRGVDNKRVVGAAVEEAAQEVCAGGGVGFGSLRKDDWLNSDLASNYNQRASRESLVQNAIAAAPKTAQRTPLQSAAAAAPMALAHEEFTFIDEESSEPEFYSTYSYS